MKLFLDRNKTLLPRIDVIFLLTRIMAFVSVVWFAISGDYTGDDKLLFWAVAATYAMMILFFVGGMRRIIDLKLAYLGSIMYDVIFLPLFIIYTGGLASSFYLLLYLTVSVAAYVLTFPVALTIAVVMGAVYIAAVAGELGAGNIFDFSMRIIFMWVFFLALSYVSEYMHKSERRLMKLFNTLNKRTQELERSQAQLEMIYENTRVLASILESQDVIKEVMRIMGSTLGYTNFLVGQKKPGGGFFSLARSHNGKVSYHVRPLPVKQSDLVDKAIGGQSAIRIKDTTARDDYQAIYEGTHSAIVVPLTFHGQSAGLLIAESSEPDGFTERDEQLLSVVARSAGLALENAELVKRTEELSIIDELTNSFNYRYFIQKFEEEKKRAVRYGLPLSIIMIDIDWFKKLNDGYGHEAGNVVLKTLSRVISSCIRDVDIFCRYGGEEFVVILPQTAQAEARPIAERIRAQVEATPTDTGTSGPLSITVSVGVSSYPENGKSEEELVSVADQALYKAKGSGKNLVCSV